MTRNTNRPRSIHQYSSMAPRPSGQSSISGGVFFVSKSLGNRETKEIFKNVHFRCECLGVMLEK